MARRAMHVPRTEHRALAVTELVEHEVQSVIVRAPKVTVVRRSLLFSMYRTHVTLSRTTRRCGVRDIAPSTQLRSVAPSVLGIAPEPAHGVWCLPLVCYASVSNDYPHRRIVGQPFSIVDVSS